MEERPKRKSMTFSLTPPTSKILRQKLDYHQLFILFSIGSVAGNSLKNALRCSAEFSIKSERLFHFCIFCPIAPAGNSFPGESPLPDVHCHLHLTHALAL
jgi:hypothetical protein